MKRIDPNLRDLLDSLNVEEGVRHPTEDMELLRSVIRRLDPDGAHRRVLDETHVGAPAPELDDELADDAGSDDLADVGSGDLSFGGDEEEEVAFTAEPLYEPIVDDDVSFERVDVAPPSDTADPYEDHAAEDLDLDDHDELMEFETIAPPVTPEWADDWPAEDADASGDTLGSWADDEGLDDPAFAWDAADEDASWAEDTNTEPTQRLDPKPSQAQAPDPFAVDDLDSQATDDLAELERQLAELERELETIGKPAKRETGPDADE